MGLFDWLLGKKKTPPAPIDPAVARAAAAQASLREFVFAETPLEDWPRPGQPVDQFPWSEFILARSHLAAGRREEAFASWQKVIATPGLESQHYAQAWLFLRERGQSPPPDIAKQVLGAIVEVGMQKGADIVAAYHDHRASYYNFSGAAIVWEHPDQSLDPLIDELLTAAADVVAKIGPWTKKHPPVIGAGWARVSFLTPSGLHFGEGPADRFMVDPMAGPVMVAALRLMDALMRESRQR